MSRPIENPVLYTAQGFIRCQSPNKQGAQCGKNALSKSEPPRCQLHAGKSRATMNIEKAARELEERGAKQGRIMLGSGTVAPVVNELEELLALATMEKGMVAGLQALVGELKTIRYKAGQGEQLRAEVLVLERAIDRYGKRLEAIARLNLDGRLVALEEAQGLVVVAVVAHVLRLNGVNPNDRLVQQQVQERLEIEAAKAELPDER